MLSTLFFGRSTRRIFLRGMLASVWALVLLISQSCNTLIENSNSNDWPQWLGKNRDGKSLEIGILKEWPASGPGEQWHKSLGGGYSGIVVSGEKLYTMTCDSTSEYTICLDANTGKEIWRTRVDSLFVDKHGNGNGPRSTPSIDGNSVISLSSFGELIAFDKSTGTQIWKRNIKTEFGSNGPVAGGAFATSPLIDDDLVFVETGGTQGNSFVALDLKTGSTKWSAESDSAAYASPTSITLHGEKQIVFFSADGVVSLNPKNGALNWRFPWKTPWGITTNTPIFIHPDKLFVSSINDMGSALIQFTSENEDSLISEVWRSNRVMNSYSTVVVHDGYVYGFQNKFLSCVALETGEEKWRQRGFSYGSLVFVDGQLVVLGEKGKLALVEATPEEYREKGTINALGNRCYTPPAISNGRLYVRDEHKIVCYDLGTI